MIDSREAAPRSIGLRSTLPSSNQTQPHLHLILLNLMHQLGTYLQASAPEPGRAQGPGRSGEKKEAEGRMASPLRPPEQPVVSSQEWAVSAE